MTSLSSAVDRVLAAQKNSRKPLAIILAGHNGSGKSTMWNKHLAAQLQMPLVNADRMMMSVLPEITPQSPQLPPWASKLRDTDQNWMKVAQKGVQAFVAQALLHHVPFAFETVFSYWERLPGGRHASKIDQIKELQKAGYFVLLFFVGLSSADLSIARVFTRVKEGGHSVPHDKLRERFPRTQMAIHAALDVANAAILADNSRDQTKAFTVCLVQFGRRCLYDCRDKKARPPQAILEWLNKVAPRHNNSRRKASKRKTQVRK